MTIRVHKTLGKLAAMTLLGLAVTCAAPAFAQETTEWESVSVQLDPGGQGGVPVMIITGTLPETRALPAEVRLAVPEGMEMVWAGEILGGPLENDPTIQPQVTHTEKGYDVATFTLSQSRTGQIELDVPQAVFATEVGVRSLLAWTPADDVGSLSLGMLVPAGSQLTTFTAGAQPEAGPSGSTVLYLELSDVPADQRLELVADYVPGQAAVSPDAAPAGDSSSSSGIVILLVLGSALAVVLIAMLRKTRGARSEAEEDAEGD
ncbi:MAG: hypothetical protein OEV43_07455 [Coriobacteriia bacterium]|nr:hypothetical protein [Coriobacteriia bacterium]